MTGQDEHERLQAEIAAYVAGRLENDEATRLEEHLATCESCAEVAAAAREIASALREGGPEMFEPHPDEMALRRHVGASPGAGDERIARHLEVCPSCSLEARYWKRRQEAGRASVPSGRGARRRPRAVWLPAAASLAAGLIIGAAFMATYLGRAPGISGPAATAPATGSAGEQAGSAPARPETPAPPAHQAGLLDRAVMSDASRGVEETPVLRCRPGQPFYVLEIVLDLPEAPSGAPLIVEFRKPGGAAVRSIEIDAADAAQQLEQYRSVSLYIPSPLLPPGSYEIVVRRGGGTGGPALLQGPLIVERTDQRQPPAPTNAPQ